MTRVDIAAAKFRPVIGSLAPRQLQAAKLIAGGKSHKQADTAFRLALKCNQCQGFIADA